MSRWPGVLPYGRQYVDDADIAAVNQVLRGDFLTTGPAVEGFEQAFAAVVDAPYAVACSNGTTGLHIALQGLGVTEGDTVIVPSVTFMATANAARYCGAEVVFADVDPTTGIMRPSDLEAALKRATGPVKAVMIVHLAGQTGDLPEISRIAKAAGAFLVEDACHAVGTVAHGAKVGATPFSDACVFSFHPVKTIACGEGGMVTTRDPELAARMARLRAHGIERRPDEYRNRALALSPAGTPNPWYHEMHELGNNYRLDDISCALGLSQLKKLAWFAERRRALTARYDAALTVLAPWVLPTVKLPANDPVLHLYVVRIDYAGLGTDRASFMAALKEHGVGTQVHYIPVHHQPYYTERQGTIDLPGADGYYAACLSLPLFIGMSDEDVDHVVASLSALTKR